MEFLKALFETDDSPKPEQFFSKKRAYETSALRIFKQIPISENVKLSIQGSWGHYCHPRLTLPKEAYASMELAILWDGEFVSANCVTDNEEIISALEEYYDGSVHAWVPVELLEKLFLELKG